MKNILIATILAVFARAGAATADTLPAGATRFSLFNDNGAVSVDVPKGKTLIVTDVVVFGDCRLLDGSATRLDLVSRVFQTSNTHFQTGLAFQTQLTSRFNCTSMTISGYWLDTP